MLLLNGVILRIEFVKWWWRLKGLLFVLFFEVFIGI